MFFLSGTRMRLCVTLANKSTSLRASVVSRSLGLGGHNLAPTEHFPERATWIKPSDSLDRRTGPGSSYRALAARIGTEVPAHVLNPAKTATGISNNRHRLVMAHGVLLREKGEEHGLAK